MNWDTKVETGVVETLSSHNDISYGTSIQDYAVQPSEEGIRMSRH